LEPPPPFPDAIHYTDFFSLLLFFRWRRPSYFSHHQTYILSFFLFSYLLSSWEGCQHGSSDPHWHLPPSPTRPFFLLIFLSLYGDICIVSLFHFPSPFTDDIFTTLFFITLSFFSCSYLPSSQNLAQRAPWRRLWRIVHWEYMCTQREYYMVVIVPVWSYIKGWQGPGPPGCQFISILLTRGIGTHKHLPTLLPSA
jgi:hypothetical protein